MDPSIPHTVLITGGGGFVGQQLASRLLTGDHGLKIDLLILTDIVEPRVPPHVSADDARLVRVKSDTSVKSELEKLWEGREYTAICALHGVMSGGSEADFDLGMRVNLDATRGLLEHIRHSKPSRPPVFLFTSSGAVFGGPVKTVEDDTLPAPQGSYGTEKLICEYLVYEYTRRGWIDGRSVRLPTVTVRPGAPNTALSSYASSIVREPLQGKPAICPVAKDFKIFVTAPSQVVTNFVKVLALPGKRFPSHTRTVNLPGIAVSTTEILSALETVGGPEARALVTFQESEEVRRIVDGWPGFWNTLRAFDLGLEADKDFLSAVREYKAELDAGRG